jgi:hypothetical protein
MQGRIACLGCSVCVIVEQASLCFEPNTLSLLSTPVTSWHSAELMAKGPLVRTLPENCLAVATVGALGIIDGNATGKPGVWMAFFEAFSPIDS